MKHRILTWTLLVAMGLTAKAQKIKVPAVIADAEKQTTLMLQEIGAAKGSKTDLITPRSLDKGQLKLVPSRDWTSGFFAGKLWFLYQLTGKQEWKEEAEKFTALMEAEKTNGRTHDMGFKIYCSFGAGYNITKNAEYKNVIIQGAKTLSTRFNKATGVIKSWDNRARWKNPVIIDNMMNLELLFEASKLTGDRSFRDIAVSHANTTMKNHYRTNYSSYHVVDYDSATGKVVQRTTHQGYNNESSWSRGQSWGLYGFAMCYRETGDKKYLEHAEHIADYILKHPNLPADLVPYWDFDAPGIPNEPRDASAASILASGLYELSTYSTRGRHYRAVADKIIENLTNGYRSPVGENKGFILLHSTGEKPINSEVDVPITYADYYYLEALLRSRRLAEGKPL